MRVLLNATAAELAQLGGDFTHYRDYRRLAGDGVSYEFVPPDRVRRACAILRKAFEKSCRTWQPAAMQRRLFLASRYLYVPPKAAGNADLIFSHLLFPAGTGDRIPIVWSSQGISPAAYYERYNPDQWTVEDVAWIYRQLGRRADALIIFTETCARNVVAWCPELEGKIHCIPAPVFAEGGDPAGKPSRRDGLIRLLFVGVDSQRKGLPEVIEAYSAVRERAGHIRLDIVSRPSQALQRRIGLLRDAQLHWSSPGVDVKALMKQADIFVLPTHADTYALATVEAMAHGCATIISDLDPLPEVAGNGETGFAVPVGDSRALADSLQRMISNLDLLRSFQENAKRRFRKLHAPEVVASRLNQLFAQILRRRKAPDFRTDPIGAIREANNQDIPT